MIQFYATVDSDSIRPAIMPTNVAYLLPASSFWRRKWMVPKMPEGVEIGVDCGGYVMTKKHGTYPYTFADYVSWVEDIPGVRWAAMPDYCCEDDLTAGDVNEVADTFTRQEWTTATARHFLERWGHVDFAWVPTIQGWNVDDYIHHAKRLAPLVWELQRWYEDFAGYDYEEDDNDMERRQLAGSAFRVAIGTLCRRASPEMIREIVKTVSEILPGVPLHLWGVKVSALAGGAMPSCVVSADSAAWNGRFGKGIEKQRASGLTQREYSYKVALPVYTAQFNRQVNGQQAKVSGYKIPRRVTTS